MTRIYIPYLPVSLSLIVLYTLLPEVSGSDRNFSIFTSITLIPSSAEPALSVGWTLVHEMAFYSIFIVYFFLPGFRFLIGAWAMTIVALWIGGVDLGHRASWLRAYFDPINLEFIGGMIAFLVAQRVDAKWWPALLFAGLVGASVYFTYHEALHRVLFGASIVPIVVAMVLLERKGLRAPEWLVFLGSASYAIYLVHKPVISLVVRISDYASFWPLAFLACLSSSVVVGAIYHLAFERPALALAKKTVQALQGSEKH